MQKLLNDYVNEVSVETYIIKKPEIENDRERVYNAILENGGSFTCKELADKWGCPAHCISGRFTELHNLNRIEPIYGKDGKILKKYLPNYKGEMYPHTVWRVRI